LGSATAAAVVEAEGEAGAEASALVGAAAMLAGTAGAADTTGLAVTLAGTDGAAGTAAGEQVVGRLGATTEAGARAQSSAVGGNGHRAEGAPAVATDSGPPV
jgi:hypothetical protein